MAPHAEAKAERHSQQRSAEEKVDLFRRRFSGLTQVYGTYDPRTGRACQVKAPVTNAVILAHIQGRTPYGVYLLVKDRTLAAAVDFDHDDPLPVLEFVDAARHYGLRAYVERSKSKGYHAWLFFEEGGVLAAKARAVIRRILEEIGAAGVEVFPKQDALGTGTFYGNFINAPLFGALVPSGRTVFVDPAIGLKPFPDQWDVLDATEPISERKLDEIIEMNDIPLGYRPLESAIQREKGGTPPRGGLAPCARRMLREGVRENQRVACFRLAVHLRKVGLPLDLATAALMAWARRNRPLNGKQVISDGEIAAQASYAYKREYLGYGCEDPAVAPYCDPRCPVIARRAPIAEERPVGSLLPSVPNVPAHDLVPDSAHNTNLRDERSHQR